jgi:hypothetical protein
MFHSGLTPPFGQIAAQLFGQANPNQHAHILNQLLGSVASSALASLGSGAGGGVLAGLIEQLTQGGGTPAAITPEEASSVTPEQVQQIASHVEQHSRGIIDKMSSFYAEHPDLVRRWGVQHLALP